jgi:hypothetical protein
MKIGYIRVSKDKQATILQEDAMKREECQRVFVDKMTGKRFDRPEYLTMLKMARPGDIIVVWRLDRLGRSLRPCFGMHGGNPAWQEEQDRRSFVRGPDGRMSCMQ